MARCQLASCSPNLGVRLTSLLAFLQAKLMPMLATCYALNFAKNKVRASGWG